MWILMRVLIFVGTILSALVIGIIGTGLIMVVLTFMDEAEAKSVATITVIGTPPSVLQQCEAEKEFTYRIIKFREEGRALQEIRGMITARMIAAGLPIDAVAEGQKTITELWAMEGTSTSIADLIYQLCIDAYKEQAQ